MPITRRSQMRHLDRLARQRHKDAQAASQTAAEDAQARKADEHQRIEREIRNLIPSVLSRLEHIEPEQSGMQSLTYEVPRVRRLEDRFGWREVTRAAWELGQWTIPTSRSSTTTPVWLLSNGLIAWNGLDGEPIADTIENIAELWPTMLSVILGGLRELRP